MSGPRFLDLFAWEWRQVGRSRLLWLVLAILSASFVWGALNTASLHRSQTAALERARAADIAWEQRTAQLARDFHGPVTQVNGQVAYWQDPTNIGGYSEYFVRKTALKPHLPLSPLAAGVSDLAPSRLEIKLNTPFGFADTYDFENPRSLALGRFDLAFAIVFVLPIGLLLLFALLVTFEKDRGMLRLMAAQAASPRLWIGARVTAILAWVAPIVLFAIALGLTIAGVPIGAVAGALGTALLLTLLYMLFWSGIALLVLGGQPGAGTALGLFAAIWAGITIGLPLAGSALVGALDPAPSAIGYVDAQRRTNDAIQTDATSIITRAMHARPNLRAHVDRIATIDHATKLSFLVPETERRLASLKTEIENHRVRQEATARTAGYLIPSLGLEGALASLAGTDAERQRAFEKQAREYQHRLRERVQPLVHQRITLPPAPEKRATRGVLDLPQPLKLPSFAQAERPASDMIRDVLPFAGWLFILAVIIIGLGFRRIRRWKVI